MGRVFIARDRSLGRKIAIKELRTDVGGSYGAALPDARAARFLREAQITAMLEHPAITPVHELGVREDGTLYYTMKFVQGVTLSELIAGTDSVEERLRYVPNLIAVAHAVAYAHSRGVIHRDIKPENIVVGDYGESVLVDWGVAKVDSDDSLWMDVETHSSPDDDPDEGLTLPGSILGTPAYMPPEQALGRNRELDGRADVYALGAVLYTLLTGERPFTGGTATEVLQKVVRNAPVPIRKRAPDAPKELVAICEKAMSKDRDDRFENAQSFTEDLTRHQEGSPVRSYRYTLTERAARLILRHR
ncbi:MAG: serine/threonine protein kinase, partial [Candidatus Hydrogenedentes bacterium]|nr:serine/threonine protein kinase [Candidatus Hydrogenedentota bacterium]